MKSKINSIDNLRAFVIVLVVLHHAVLAYHTAFAYYDAYLFADMIPVSNLINPIIDAEKWQIFDLITGINDTWFMSLMFLISGLFVWGGSLRRKGIGNYIKDRAIRLGRIFIVGVLVIIPLPITQLYFKGRYTQENKRRLSFSFGGLLLGKVFFVRTILVYLGIVGL